MNQRDDRFSEASTRDAHTPSRVVQSKLFVPRLDARSIRRECVADLADQAREARLVLFRAPSGFGKTTAMQRVSMMTRRMPMAGRWPG